MELHMEMNCVICFSNSFMHYNFKAMKFQKKNYLIFLSFLFFIRQLSYGRRVQIVWETFERQKQPNFQNDLANGQNCYEFCKNWVNIGESLGKTFSIQLTLLSIGIPIISSNPSIDGNTPFIPCTSQTELFCQEINNSPKLSVTTNIKEQLHFDTWHEIETTYKNLQ